MKKIMLAAGLLISLYSNAQLVFTTAGEEITNNQVFEYATLYEMPFRVQNTSEDLTKYLRVRVDELTNTNGTSVQLCFGVCLFQVQENTVVPPSFPIVLEPGQQNSAQDHIWNTNEGDGVNYPMDFKLTFFEEDENGTFVGDVLTMTYRYNPQLGLPGVALDQLGITNLNTVLNNTLNIRSTAALSMEVVGLNGQVVRRQQLNAGEQSVDVSSLSQGVYVVRFTNDQNVSAQVKVMKK
ncbi:MAG: T9SS type A sorting domain-containing protein [Chitinophagaceae bacterium]|nr:MAG: T9SS type A sorting domain-containing protein [Chitinophagaceae bacterium]